MERLKKLYLQHVGSEPTEIVLMDKGCNVSSLTKNWYMYLLDIINILKSQCLNMFHLGNFRIHLSLLY